MYPTDLTVAAVVNLDGRYLMVEEQSAGWRLSGVFDFEPSMVGHHLYDLPAITMFVARGEPSLAIFAGDRQGASIRHCFYGVAGQIPEHLDSAG